MLGVMSLVGLLATLAVYCQLGEQHTLHGKIVLANVVPTLGVHIYLLIVYNQAPPPADTSSPGCTALGYTGYTASLAMFSWMTVMCWDLSSRLAAASATQDQGGRLRVYLRLGCGLPAGLGVLAGMVQLTTSSEFSLNPGIGRGTCFVQMEGGRMLFWFHIPVFLLLLGNLSGFIRCLHLMRQRPVPTIQRWNNSTAHTTHWCRPSESGRSSRVLIQLQIAQHQLSLAEHQLQLDQKTRRDLVSCQPCNPLSNNYRLCSGG